MHATTRLDNRPVLYYSACDGASLPSFGRKAVKVLTIEWTVGCAQCTRLRKSELIWRSMRRFSENNDVRISDSRFEELVQEALDEIPDALWQMIDNLAVMIEPWPSRLQMRSARVGPGHILLGLYEGVPLTERSQAYGLVPPDKITIFREPILRHVASRDEDAIRAQVRRTVLHEIAHHFGISDERLHEIGAY